MLTRNATAMKKTIRDYYEQLYTNKSENLEMNKFLETFNISRLYHEETEGLYRRITNKELDQ